MARYYRRKEDPAKRDLETQLDALLRGDEGARIAAQERLWERRWAEAEAAVRARHPEWSLPAPAPAPPPEPRPRRDWLATGQAVVDGGRRVLRGLFEAFLIFLFWSSLVAMVAAWGDSFVSGLAATLIVLPSAAVIGGTVSAMRAQDDRRRRERQRRNE